MSDMVHRPASTQIHRGTPCKLRYPGLHGVVACKAAEFRIPVKRQVNFRTFTQIINHSTVQRESVLSRYEGSLLNIQPAPARFGKEGEIFDGRGRSEEHTSELQSRGHLVCRLLLE